MCPPCVLWTQGDSVLDPFLHHQCAGPTVRGMQQEVGHRHNIHAYRQTNPKPHPHRHWHTIQHMHTHAHIHVHTHTSTHTHVHKYTTHTDRPAHIHTHSYTRTHNTHTDRQTLIPHVGHVHFVYIRMNRVVSAHFSPLPWLRMWLSVMVVWSPMPKWNRHVKRHSDVTSGTWLRDRRPSAQDTGPKSQRCA